MTEIVKKEVCRCVNCGNEAEMVFTCTLPDGEAATGPASKPKADEAAHAARHVKATGTCTHCGNEADMWIDV